MNDSIVSSSGAGTEAPDRAAPGAPRQPGVATRPPGSRLWLLLTHHLPPEPAYFRVKVRRRLERIGAVALKNSVYVLPASEDALEDFQWLLREIRREGGEATLSESRFLDPSTDDRLVADFRARRDEEYEEIVRAARGLREELTDRAAGSDPPSTIPARVQRLGRRLEEVIALDYFEATGRSEARRAVEALRRRALSGTQEPVAGTTESGEGGTTASAGIGSGRTWVTRKGVKVDRIASAWLIRRCIDPDARLRFVPPQGYEPAGGEIRFDMFEGEFTHVGDACTFETLLAAFRLEEPALTAIGEIIHDIDCKDEKFGRGEVPGIASLIDGIVRGHPDDLERIERGGVLFDDLREHFRSTSA